MHYCATFYRTILFFFFFNDTATTEIYPLSLHDALPISSSRLRPSQMSRGRTSIWQRPATTWASFSRWIVPTRSEEHTSELQSRLHLVCRLLLEKKKTATTHVWHHPLSRRPQPTTYVSNP